jgi:hypothetical protein
MQHVLIALIALLERIGPLVGAAPAEAQGRPRSRAGSDRGDVPGWVLVTVMTAGLVMTLWLVADDQLSRIFSDAIGSVTGP